MLQVTLNLENEQVLSGKIEEMFEKLSESDIKEIASNALFKYLTDTVDYEKQKYIDEKIAHARLNGLTGQYNNNVVKTPEELKEMTDFQIQNLYDFRSTIDKYKSSKESRFDQIQKLLNEQLKSKVEEFVRTNNDLQNIILDNQKNISDNFVEIVKDVMSNIGMSFLATTIQNANHSAMGVNVLKNHMNAMNPNQQIF